jgi:hypothetical protein
MHGHMNVKKKACVSLPTVMSKPQYSSDQVFHKQCNEMAANLLRYFKNKEKLFQFYCKANNK